MKRVACSLLLAVGLTACSSGPFLTRAQDAHLGASFACGYFDLVFPTEVVKKIAFTPQERIYWISHAAEAARGAASSDKKWTGESRALDALDAGMRNQHAAALPAAVAKVRKVCDPLNVANGLTP